MSFTRGKVAPTERWDRDPGTKVNIREEYPRREWSREQVMNRSSRVKAVKNTLDLTREGIWLLPRIS